MTVILYESLSRLITSMGAWISRLFKQIFTGKKTPPGNVGAIWALIQDIFLNVEEE